jgi:hypothetical protein
VSFFDGKLPDCAFEPETEEKEIVCGDVRDAEGVDNTVNGAEAVVSCLGALLLQTFKAEGHVNTYGHAQYHQGHAIAGCETHRRHVILRRRRFAQSYECRDAIRMSTVMHGVLADMNALEEVLQASQLDWTVVRPVNLKDSPSSGKLIVDRPGNIRMNDWVSRGEIAAFMLASLGDATTIRRVLLLSESH